MLSYQLVTSVESASCAGSCSVADTRKTESGGHQEVEESQDSSVPNSLSHFTHGRLCLGPGEEGALRGADVRLSSSSFD